MSTFLQDQRANASQYNPIIDKETDRWLVSLLNQQETPDSDEEREQLEKMKGLVESARNAGKSGKYWAFIFFRYLSSSAHLTMLRMQLLSGNSSQNITLNIQRYSSILSILDPSEYFTRLFVEMVQIFQLTSVLPSLIDHGSNMKELTLVMKTIHKAFVEKHIDSQNPKIQEAVVKIREAIQKEHIDKQLTILMGVAATAGSNSWAHLVSTFESKIAKLFGIVGIYAAKMVLFAGVGATVALLASGNLSFSDLSGTQQSFFVLASVNVVTIFVRSGIEAAIAYRTLGSLKDSMRVLFFEKLSVAQDQVGGEFGKWIAQNTNSNRALRLYFNRRFENQHPKLANYLEGILYGNTRFSAAMAVTGIVLSAISLAESETGIEKAMNSLFLAASILELVGAVSVWAVSTGITMIGGLAISSI